MRQIRLPRVDSDAALGIAGVSLALGSVLFAIDMNANTNRKPDIAGLQHLAIYAKPSSTQDKRRTTPREIDFAPVGSTRGNFSRIALAGYEVLEASRDHAIIRLPEGRVARVSAGDRLPQIGEIVSIRQRMGKWAVVTSAGVLEQR